MPIESLQDAISALPPRPTSGYIADYLRRFATEGHFTPLVGKRTVEMAESVGLLAAERLIDNCRVAADDPAFDFDQYSRLCLIAFKRFGRKTGSSFCLRYGEIFQLGINPQQYFDNVEIAVNAGGKVFGGYFALYLPEVIEAGGDTQLFRSHSAHIRHLGGVKTARYFMRDADKIFRLEDPPFEVFSKVVLDSIDQFGKDAAFWVIRAMTPLVTQFNYHPKTER